MEQDSSAAHRVKSFIRNIFHANPLFLRFCLDTFISKSHNSKQVKYLAQRYQNFNRGISMPVHPNVRSCTHIKVTGVRCGSPAMRGEHFCYFHQRMIRGVRTPPESRLHPIALIEDEESIQVALMEVINALMRNTIDVKRAALILRALNIAARNVRHMKFGIHDNTMIKEVPNYPGPPVPEHESVPAPAQWSANMTPAQVAAKIRADRAEAAASAHVGTDAFVRPSGPEAPAHSAVATTTHVGTDAFVRPSGPASPGRSALPSATTSADTSRPKPPASVKEDVKPSAAPKERKAGVGTGTLPRPGGPAVSGRG
jgi:hypothetical protein